MRVFVNKELIKLEYISTNIADIISKSLQRVKNSCFTNMLLQDQESLIQKIIIHMHLGHTLRRGNRR